MTQTVIKTGPYKGALMLRMKGQGIAAIFASNLVKASKWFVMTPLPDDEWEFIVKDEAEIPEAADPTLPVVTRALHCDMRPDCSDAVTHIGEKGYTYCSAHAPNRQGTERVRKMRVWEINILRSGQPLPTYKRRTKRWTEEYLQLRERMMQPANGWAK